MCRDIGSAGRGASIHTLTLLDILIHLNAYSPPDSEEVIVLPVV